MILESHCIPENELADGDGDGTGAGDGGVMTMKTTLRQVLKFWHMLTSPKLSVSNLCLLVIFLT